MKPALYCIIIISSIIALNACQPSGDINEKELYTILNEIIADDSLHVDVVCWKFTDTKWTPDYKSKFNTDDIAFIERQKLLYKDKTVLPNALHWSPRRSTSVYSSFVDSACDKDIVYHISFPLISLDRKKVIVEFREDCNCNMGSQGGKNFYEKRKGHWIRTQSF
ncbi:MAG: hypothetical protein PSX81_04075 [bacterium]|nr:hypothetical protein [bacterium]